ncbi:MAG: cation:dicarboxylate symporter family transporter [Mycoplasmatales bacterium]
MENILPIIILAAVYFAICYGLVVMKNKKLSFNKRILTGLGTGIVFGVIIQFLFGSDGEVTSNFMTFLSIFGNGYVRLLGLMVIPLVLFAMTTSVMNIKSEGMLVKIAPKILMFLMLTVGISAVVGIVVSQVIHVDATQIQQVADPAAVAQREAYLAEQKQGVTDQTYAEYILGIIPRNIVNTLTGQNDTDTLSTVLFGMFLGYAVLQVRKRKPEKVQTFVDFMNAGQEVILSMVREILKLTPFAITALMTSFAASNSIETFNQMFKFLGASYIAIFAMLGIHFLMILLFGLSPMQYIKKSWPVFLFGFGSRSSVSALPLNIEAQTERLGVDLETANLSATFSTSIGQNGCAGIYPAMVAIIAAQAQGVDITFTFLVTLVLVIIVSSFGIAGVGGGATFSAIAVLTIMGLDIGVAALLISIEPLIDMARTALNISDGMLSGVLTARMNKTLDVEVYNNNSEAEVVEV